MAAVAQGGGGDAERAVGGAGGDAAVVGVRAVHVTAEGLLAAAAQGVGYGDGIAARDGSGGVEGAAQGELHHLHRPGDLRHLHLIALTGGDTHLHGVAANAEVGGHVNGVGAACRHGLLHGGGVRSVGHADDGVPGIAGALAGGGVGVVIFVGELHFVAHLHSGVGGDSREHDFGGGHAAATTAGEHVARVQHLAVLVEQAQAVGFLRPLADGVQLEGCAVLAAHLPELGGDGLVFHGVGGVLVDGGVYRHFGDFKLDTALLVGGEGVGGGSLTHGDLLDGSRTAVLLPCSGIGEGGERRAGEAVVRPFARALLEGEYHAGLLLVLDACACQCRHCRLLGVVSACQRMFLRHVVEAASAAGGFAEVGHRVIGALGSRIRTPGGCFGRALGVGCRRVSFACGCLRRTCLGVGVLGGGVRLASGFVGLGHCCTHFLCRVEGGLGQLGDGHAHQLRTPQGGKAAHVVECFRHGKSGDVRALRFDGVQ